MSQDAPVHYLRAANAMKDNLRYWKSVQLLEIPTLTMLAATTSLIGCVASFE